MCSFSPTARAWPAIPKSKPKSWLLQTLNVVPSIARYAVSINDNFISEKIKNLKGFILLVEYVKIRLNYDIADGTVYSFALTVAHPLSDTSSDNLNEVLLMNEALAVLDFILRCMNEQQHELDFCGSLIKWPAEIHPVDPVAFFGCGGWTASFTNSLTLP